MEIDILIEEFAWFTADIEGLAEVACPATLAELGLTPAHFEISILTWRTAKCQRCQPLRTA